MTEIAAAPASIENLFLLPLSLVTHSPPLCQILDLVSALSRIWTAPPPADTFGPSWRHGAATEVISS